jgi:aldose 1-epimerase
MKTIKKLGLGAGLALAMMASCDNKSTTTNLTDSGLNPEDFKSEFGGKQTDLFVLKNANGMEVCITNFGGRIVSVNVPDKNGDFKDVVLGFDKVTTYEDTINTPSDFGAAIGRYANRINKGIIVIDGDSIQLPTNNFGHCLHGGPQGWQYQVYDGKLVNDSTVTMTMHSEDGDANFPGNVEAVVTYTLTSDNAIDIKYEATTDKKTVINMTNHSYFNLNGDPTQPVTNHVLYINADNFTPVDTTYMTTGEILPVAGTPMDFTTPTELAKDIKNFSFEQIKNANGFDHNWVLNTQGDESQVACRVYSPVTGIQLEVYTNEPGVQFYSGNFLDGNMVEKGKKGITYQQHAGMCLETQKYPDTPNKPEWPSAFLSPGEKYYSHCIFKFSVKK